MKKILVIAATLMVSTLVWGQPNLRPWEHGPLTWSDFSVVHESIGAEHSYLEFILDIENRTRDYDGISIPVRTAVAYMDKNLSWVDSIHRTPQELRYNRALFNLVELYRRRLQLELDTSGKADLNYYMRLLTYEADSFCRSTYYGSDTVAVAWWEYDIRRQLDSVTPLMVAKHQEANRVSGYRPQGTLAMSLGGGSKFFVGDLHNYFSPSCGFYMDIDFGRSRHVFTGGMYIGGGGCRPDTIFTINERNMLLHNDLITTIDLHVDYGFTLLDRYRYTLTPFVGFGLQGVYYNNDDEISNGPSEGCWRVGADFKYDIGQECSADAVSLSQFGFALHGKVYVSFDRFRSIVGSPQGQTINAQVGFSFRAREKEILRPAQQSR